MTAVLFDMDGVVVDSERYWVPKETETILPEVVPDQGVAVDELTGRPYTEMFTYLDSNYDVAVTRERFLELFDEAAREIYGEQASLLDGFEDICRDLRDRDVGIALVTSSPYEWLNIVLDRFDLTFDAVVSGDDVEAGKPAPDIYQRAAREMGERPDDCIAVEDSANGVASAKAAGAYCIGYTGVHEALDPEEVDAVATDPESLRTRLFERLDEMAQ